MSWNIQPSRPFASLLSGNICTVEIFSADQVLLKITSDMRYAGCVIDQLHILGYTLNFEVTGQKLICVQTRQVYMPKELTVDEVYQFERETKGLQSYFLYALRNHDKSVMGIFSAYPVPEF